jgi:hypothetical protein
MANLSSSTGYTPLQTRIPLVNSATTNVQDFALYDAQTLTGLVYIDATTDKRAAVTVTIVRNGAGTYEVGATDIVGDDNSGLPIVSFSMSGSILQATLVSYAGFVSAYIQFHLAAPVFGANYPLTVSTTNIVGRTDGVAQSAGYVGQKLSASLSNVTLTNSNQDYDAGSLTLTAGVWMVYAKLIIGAAGTTQTVCSVSISTTSVTTNSVNSVRDLSTTIAQSRFMAAEPFYINTAGQTIYLVAFSTFTGASPVTNAALSEFFAVRIA